MKPTRRPFEDFPKLYAAPDIAPVKNTTTANRSLTRKIPVGALRLLLLLFLTAIFIAAGRATPQPARAAEPVDFGARLVAAARKQTWIPVIYNPAYRNIGYPNGDVPWYFGVCTDVIVRAYRSLDIDLQVLVHEARVGSGDTNIDHRRVPVLKRFFERRARSLPVTKDPADYAAGDIVTYFMPDGRFSKTHIAIVSDRKNSSGVPLIIHNRGWGVSEEDWLFDEKITGHFRFAPQEKTAEQRHG
ncbi:MAG: DUF1287 domain-containing protein [Hyphomicrobiaceae bacterium]